MECWTYTSKPIVPDRLINPYYMSASLKQLLNFITQIGPFQSREITFPYVKCVNRFYLKVSEMANMGNEWENGHVLQDKC